jgi:uncharacterized protein (DUF433 family)
MKERERSMLVATRYEHIILNDSGEPIIAGTNMKVKELVAERLGWGWSPEELLLNHPYLTLGQIYSALAYYADHAAEIEVAIQDDLDFYESMREKAGTHPLVARLRSQQH